MNQEKQSAAHESADVPVSTRYFEAHGKVQKVMFRQTLIRGMQSRGILGGATNEKAGHVTITMSAADESVVESAVQCLREANRLNSWGAHYTSILECTEGKAVCDHQVNTANVDSFKWNKKVKMFL